MSSTKPPSAASLSQEQQEINTMLSPTNTQIEHQAISPTQETKNENDDDEMDGGGDLDLIDHVAAMLQNEEFIRCGKRSNRCFMINLANSVGGPNTSRMKLVPESALILKPGQKPRLPHSSDGVTIDAVNVFLETKKNENVEIFFYSHRWLRPNHPDNDEGDKARVLSEFIKYRKKWTKYFRGFESKLYFWIDLACVDQANAIPDLSKLPLWIACCSHMVTFTAPDYYDRAWCRLEQLLAVGFMYTDHQSVVNAHFKDQHLGGTEFQCRRNLLLDPGEGKLSIDNDRQLIRRFSGLAWTALATRRHWVNVEYGVRKGLKEFNLNIPTHTPRKRELFLRKIAHASALGQRSQSMASLGSAHGFTQPFTQPHVSTSTTLRTRAVARRSDVLTHSNIRAPCNSTTEMTTSHNSTLEIRTPRHSTSEITTPHSSSSEETESNIVSEHNSTSEETLSNLYTEHNSTSEETLSNLFSEHNSTSEETLSNLFSEHNSTSEETLSNLFSEHNSTSEETLSNLFSEHNSTSEETKSWNININDV